MKKRKHSKERQAIVDKFYAKFPRDKVELVMERSANIRTRNIMLAAAAGRAWHPDVTVAELEREGAAIYEKIK